jgi:hypothetical protein
VMKMNASKVARYYKSSEVGFVAINANQMGWTCHENKIKKERENSLLCVCM